MKAGGGTKDGSDGYHPMTPTTNNKAPFIWGILATSGKPSNRPMFVPRFMICLLVFISSVYFLYTINLLLSPSLSHRQLPCSTTTTTSSAVADPVLLHLPSSNISVRPPKTATTITRAAAATGLQHIVFGIAASASLWDRRKDYIKLWWRPRQMRGFVWLDIPVKEFDNSPAAARLPALKLSGDTARFPYTHRKGSRSAIRISRIVSETFRLGLGNVRWFVMGDDDTVFVLHSLWATTTPSSTLPPASSPGSTAPPGTTTSTSAPPSGQWLRRSGTKASPSTPSPTLAPPPPPLTASPAARPPTRTPSPPRCFPSSPWPSPGSLPPSSGARGAWLPSLWFRF